MLLEAAAMEVLDSFTNNFGLIDIGFQGHPFTWSN